MESWQVVISLLVFFGWWVLVAVAYWYLINRVLRDFENAPLDLRRELFKTRRQRNLKK